MAKDQEVKGLSVADLIEALKALKGDDDETLKKRAAYEAEAHARVNKRENEFAPGISVYSYPEGDRAAAEAGKIKRLKAEMYWVGYPLDVDHLTPTEVDLLNQAREGEFLVTKTDGSDLKFTVKVETTATGQPRKVEFMFPCRDGMKHNMPSMVSMLRQAFALPTEEQQEIARLKAQLKSLQPALA